MEKILVLLGFGGLFLGFIFGLMWIYFDFDLFIGLVMGGSFTLTFITYKFGQKKNKEIN